jgi:DNA-binding SARP family transcriptional activator
MSDLQINLLGSPEIRWDQQLLNVNRRIPRTILFYLASSGNLVGREKLLTFFWEDTPSTKARRNLRGALSRLRSEIPDPDLLIIHNDLVGLDDKRASIDQQEFIELHDIFGNQPWIIPAEEAIPEKVFQPMIRAANLWRGSEFMEGADLPSNRSLYGWWQQTNLHLTHLRTRLCTRICDHYRASGHLEDALTFARTALESDNLNEDVHLRVMILLVDMGQDQEAHQYYASVVKLLSDELDTQPSQQLVSVYRQIQKRTFSTRDPSQPEWRLRASLHTPFVGRQTEFNKLHKVMESGGGMVISGESGLGKTRLVQEFCELFASDRRIFKIHCRPAEMNLPYQPIIEILRNQISIAEWQDFPSIWTEPLALLLPELLSKHPSLNPSLVSYDPEHNRSTLLEAIRQVFLAISRKSNLILFLDDVQWADEATLSTIFYLIERPPFDSGAFIILSVRSDEINPGLEKFLTQIDTFHNLSLIHLERLNQKEIAGLGRYVMGYPIKQELVDQLEHETGGIPFIILETLRATQATETLVGQLDTHSLPLAQSVYTLIKNRIARLSPVALDTCEFAAVIGPEFDPELISLASQQNFSIIARAIEELKQRTFIEPVDRPDKASSWRFIHDKIRETILLDTNPIRLRFLHEHVARAMELQLKSQSRSQSAVLAHHYELAGKVAAALNYWLKAAQWAHQLFSTAEARQIFSHAEKLVTTSADVISDELIHDFYSEWTEMAYETQNANLIRDLNSNLLKIGRERKSQLLIGTALDGFSDVSLAENKFEEGLAYTAQAITYLDQTNNIYEKMDAQIHRGVFLYMLGRVNEAIESFELALKLGDGDNDPQIQSATANAYYQLALCQTLAGWPELGHKNALISLDLADRIDHHHIAITAYTASSLALYFKAEYERAERDNQKGIEIAKRLKANRMLGYLYAIKGFLDSARGDLGSAYDSAQSVFQLGEKYNHHDTLALGHRVIGDIFLLIDAPEKACDYFQEGVKSGRGGFWGLDNLVRLGYAQIRTDQTDIGMVNLHRGIDLAQSTGLGVVEIRGLQFLSYAYIYLNEWELALKVAEQLESQANRRSMPLVLVISRFIGGIARQNLGHQQDILEHLQSILNSLEYIGQPFIEVRILTQLVRVKKALELDPASDISKTKEILAFCEPNAHPEIVKKTFLEYKKSILSQISA